MIAFLSIALSAALGSRANATDVLTYHNDNARTGLNSHETILTLGNVRIGTFGKVFSYPIDGPAFAQPLTMTGVSIPGRGTHDLVFVATEHDSVYAFDANPAEGASAEPLWHVNFLSQGRGNVIVSTVSPEDVDCDIISPEIGITGTPVIDRASGTLYVVAETKERGPDGTRFVHRLHALDVASGAEKVGGPVVIGATVGGEGAGSAEGVVAFDSLRENNRCALGLANGVVYLAFASFCDIEPYHGWIFGYDSKTLRQLFAINITPDGEGGGVWECGGGPAVDSDGDIYLATGNGTFSLTTAGSNMSNSVLHLRGDTGELLDYFTPSNQAALSTLDADLGSGGVLLVPELPGVQRHLLVAAGKNGTIYLLDRDNLGKYDPNHDSCLQAIPKAIGPASGTPAFFSGKIYYGGAFDYLKAFSISDGSISPTPVSQSSTFFDFRSASPSISANGTTNAIVWQVQFGDPAILHAYDAANLQNELFNSNEAPGGRDHPGASVRFSVATVANGKVYVASQTELTVYGLLRVRRRPVGR